MLQKIMVVGLALFVLPNLAMAQAKEKEKEKGNNKELKEYESKAGKYKILLPGKVTEQSQVVKTAAGDLKINMAIVEVNFSSAIVVSHNDYPDAIANAPADKVLDGAVNGVIGKKKKIDVKEITYMKTKIPGREFSYEDDKTVGHARVYLDGTRLYQILVLGDEDTLKTIDHKKILESFQIVK